MSLIIILTKPPSHHAVTALIRILKYSSKPELYACGDGVYSLLTASLTNKAIREILNKGGSVYASKEDIEARGITANLIIDGVKIEKAFYDVLVDGIMKDGSVPLVI